MDTNQLFDLFVIISGAYMLYSAITGKGSLYKSEYIKKGFEEKYKKFVRWFCLCGGLIACAAGLFDYIKNESLAMIMYAILTLIIILYIIIIVRFSEPKNPKH
jgi:hypothetical protein